MQVDAQYQDKLNAITHSPYYGCTVRVVSKAGVSYEGVLDGISTNKEQIFLKNVRVNANITASPDRNNLVDDLNKNNRSDTLNAVMIDHLTNDIRTYEQVCLNVLDIQELKLIQLPSTFHESKEKLRAIDPCLVDIRLSQSDAYETRSNESNNDYSSRVPIARRKRGESFGSNGGSALISSSSNESSSSFGLRSNEKFADESNDESIDEQINKFSQLKTTTENFSSKPVTLLAKKVLPKKIERRTDVPSTTPLSIHPHNNLRQTFSDNRETVYESTRVNNSNTLKKGIIINQNRKLSPIRVTITSKLNPNATPFYTQQRMVSATQNPSFTFYERPRFRPRLPPVISPNCSRSLPYGINAINNNHYHHQQQQQQQQQQNYHYSHQRFIPPRQMATKKNFSQTNIRPNRTLPSPIMTYRIHPSTSLDKRSYPQRQQQQQSKEKTSNNGQFSGYMRQTSLPTQNQIISAPPLKERFSAPRNNPTRQSTVSIHSTTSLPYQYGSPNDRNQMQTPSSFAESFGSNRSQRTFSGASSCSSSNLDFGPHSIVQLDSSSNALTSFEEQYDFEKANEEFRRYLELEELVARPSSHNSADPSSLDNLTQQQQQQQSQPHSYKKEISFFDRISCTATTGTAVGYTEMDETEKNLQTFGDDALLMPSNSNNDEWQF